MQTSTTLATGSATIGQRWLTLRPVADHLRRRRAALLVLLPALLAAYLIKRYAVNVLFADEWAFVALFDQWRAGTWTFADLWAQDNEHRLVFPRVLTVMLWHWTQMDTRAGMWASWVLLCGIAAVLYWLISARAAERQTALTWFIPISWLVFNWRQTETLLWGIVMTIPLLVLCVVWAIYCLERSTSLDRYYGLATLSAVAGTFTFANGLLIWPIGALQLLGQRYLSREPWTPRLWVPVGVWSLTGVMVAMLYFRGYAKPGHHPSLLFFLHHPVEALQYFLIYWGNPLIGMIGGGIEAQVVGALLLALGGYTVAVVLCAQPLSRAALPYVSFLLFALLSGLTLVVARAGFGSAQAAAQHYILFASLGLIGSYALVPLIDSDSRRRTLHGMWASLLVFGALTSYAHGRDEARQWWAKMGEQAFFLRSSSCQPDARLRQLYPGPEVVRGLVSVLEQQRLNVFAAQLPITCHREHARPTMGDGVDTAPGTAHQGQTDYRLDVLNHRPVSSATAWTMDASQEPVLTLSGWAVDREAGGPASSVYINVDGQQDFQRRIWPGSLRRRRVFSTGRRTGTVALPRRCQWSD